MYKVYVLNIHGKPLMPTTRFGKVRRELKNGRMKVVQREPFTVQLQYETTDFVEDITLGIDTGYQNIGYSAVDSDKEHIAGTVKLRNDISMNIETKSKYRRPRRNRLRHRPARFNNRKRETGWLPPLIQHKIDSHIRIIEKVVKILPISNIVLETARFNTDESEAFYGTLRQKVLTRDGNKCQVPGCNNTDNLRIHHVVFKAFGGSDNINNLLTVCSQCHTQANHQKGGILYDMMLKHSESGNKAPGTFMSILKSRIVNDLQHLDIPISETNGKITASLRELYNIEKSHTNDAFIIAGGSNQTRGPQYDCKQRRKNNRSLVKFKDAKYMDLRDGKKKSGSELGSGRTMRRTDIEYDNLRPYRQYKISKGQAPHKQQARYPYQPGDIVRLNDYIREVKGTNNKGKSVQLHPLVTGQPNSSKPERLELIKYASGLDFKRVV